MHVAVWRSIFFARERPFPAGRSIVIFLWEVHGQTSHNILEIIDLWRRSMLVAIVTYGIKCVTQCWVWLHIQYFFMVYNPNYTWLAFHQTASLNPWPIFEKLEIKLDGKITFSTSLNAWEHLLPDVKIYNDSGFLTFIFDRVSVKEPFYTCVTKTDF